jgi:alpha-galactosidase
VALDRHALEASAAFARPTSASGCPGAELAVGRSWDGNRLSSTLTNSGAAPVRIDEIVVAAGTHGLSPDTPLYGEGVTMLSQYEGTIAALTLLGGYGDATHYRFPQRPGFRTVYDLALLSPARAPHTVLAFASSRRFAGQLRFSDTAYELVLHAEGLELAAGATWELEDVVVLTGPDPDALFADLAGHLSRVHPPRIPAQRLTGWCSWYCFGPDVTEADIVANLRAADEHGLDLTYVQIDDGYQARMGDWLEPGPLVPDPAGLCHTITELGHEPAIWVAPFIAEAGSTVLREHPEWFVADADGQPLPSDRMSYGGWRNGPWFCLDGTHPGAREHLRSVFSTMRTEWGCRYFKLDANVWGALPGGRRYDPAATRVEGYRLAMDAIRDGVGDESILLGCNAPNWASLGLVDAMRTTDDISRTPEAIDLVARAGRRRAWQGDRLWAADPDCLVVTGSKLTAAQLEFHAAYIREIGGSVLAGDDLTQLTASEVEAIRACLPHR